MASQLGQGWATQRFVHEQNLSHFVERLELEADPVQRSRIQALLVEEEDRFGSLRERLDIAEAFVRKGEACVRRQQLLISRLAGDGQDTAGAERLMANMVHLLRLFEDHRTSIATRLDAIAP